MSSPLMGVGNTLDRYSGISKFLHWSIAILVAIQVLVTIVAESVDDRMLRGEFYTLHNSIGLIILLFMLLFFMWSAINTKPKWSMMMPKWERWTARYIQIFLYVLLIAMPFSGWVMSTASGHPPVFFWLFKFPTPGVGRDPILSEVARNTHIMLAWIVGLLIIAHILSILKHHYMTKDNLLNRMMPGE